MNNYYNSQEHRKELSRMDHRVLPICFVVDRSGSMKLFKDQETGTTRMTRLLQGVEQFFAQLQQDDSLCNKAEIAVVGFGKKENPRESEYEQKTYSYAWVEQDFTSVKNCHQISGYAKGAGDTPKGVDLALSLLEKEREFLKENGKKREYPWLVIMADGRATVTKGMDSEEMKERLKRVQGKVKALQSTGELTVISVLISEANDGEYKDALQQMRDFTLTGECVDLGGRRIIKKFTQFFKTLSKSVSVGRNMFASSSNRQYTTNNTLSEEKANEILNFIKVAPIGGSSNREQRVENEPTSVSNGGSIHYVKIAPARSGVSETSETERESQRAERIAEQERKSALSAVAATLGELRNGVVGFNMDDGDTAKTEIVSTHHQSDLEKLRTRLAKSSETVVQNPVPKIPTVENSIEQNQTVIKSVEKTVLVESTPSGLREVQKTKVVTRTASKESSEYIKNLLQDLDDWDYL